MLAGTSASPLLPNARLGTDAPAIMLDREDESGGVGWYPRSGFFHIDTGPVRNWTLDDRGLDSLLLNRRKELLASARRTRLVLPGMEQSGDPLPRLANSGRVLPGLEQTGRPLSDLGRDRHLLPRSARIVRGSSLTSTRVRF